MKSQHSVFDEHRAGAFHQTEYTGTVGGHPNPYARSARRQSDIFGLIVCLSLFGMAVGLSMVLRDERRL